MKKFFALTLSVLLLVTSAPIIAEENNEEKETLKIGDYVQMGTYCGEPILWRCVSFGITETVQDSDTPIVSVTREQNESGTVPMLMSDEILCLKAFDSAATVSSDTGSHARRADGKASNYWNDSNIRSWLNSSAEAGKVEWLCSNPPVEDGIRGGYNAYDGEAGFLAGFTDAERNSIQTVTHKILVSNPEIDEKLYKDCEKIVGIDWDSKPKTSYEYSDEITDTVFLPSAEHIKEVEYNINILGAKYAVGILGDVCTENSHYEGVNFNSGNAWDYWLIDPNPNTANNVVRITKFGESDLSYSERADNSTVGIRPAFYLKEDAVFTAGSGTKEDPYIIKTDDKPSIQETPQPNATSVPNKALGTLTVYGGDDIKVSIDGKEVDFLDAKPFIDENNRTQVPVRAVSEMLDCKVIWDDTLKTVVINNNQGKVVILSIGTNIMDINDEQILMDTDAIIKDERTYIPVRFVAEALGLEVQWGKY